MIFKLQKRLELKLAYFKDAVLAMQILRHVEIRESSKHLKVTNIPGLATPDVQLVHNINELEIDENDYSYNPVFNLHLIKFTSNLHRRNYIDHFIFWLSKEQFSLEEAGKLEVGKPCMVQYENKPYWVKEILLAILPESKCDRFITCDRLDSWRWESWSEDHIMPINCIDPKIYPGNRYVWEMDLKTE